MDALEARDVMLGLFKTAWDTTGFSAVYEDLPGSKPLAEEPYAQVFVKHDLAAQASLGNTSGQRLFTNTGTLWMRVYAPIGVGMTEAYKSARLLLTAFRLVQQQGGVWYRRQRIKEQPSEGAFCRVDVLVDFSYDEAV